ncbi:renal dipeptidase family protein [Pseudooceanicola batsensis HTCC2597]|uniref:Renal dipeptidase family protein n=1 Tax=Pseudooceanicola batsensis (strain ATCC BAA-863 / DSM 15984 / KCTC 12145 / HTCC2597) TaxID=252305 RepID=A3TX10_PSEBH|nr:membrane dipeptidase [Pseudooceanicola batsensis]EAQ03370.1 renal dipeptidase family protein [Pseudooceanicola batsensis HTCC2597]
MYRLLVWIVRGLLGLALLAVLAVVAFWAFAPSYVGSARNNVIEHEPYPVSEEARALHRSLTIGDWHADPLLWKRDLTERGTWGQVDFPRLIEGNVALQVFTAVTKSPAGQNYEENSAEAFDNITLLAFGQRWPMRTWQSLYERAVHQAQKLHRFAEEDGRVTIIKGADDLEAVLRARDNGENRIGAILGIEGAHALEGEMARLDGLVDEGYRLIGLHHFFDNELGGSLHGLGQAGLTEFGRAVVREVAGRPLILDLAHSSPRVVREVLEMTDIPLVISHTGVSRFCQTQRNLPDDLMQAVAETGGVIGMGYWDEVACGRIDPAGIAAMIAAAVDLVGAEHVSLGSDFDGSVETAFDTSELVALTHALLGAGLSEDQIAAIMGGNMVRVLRDRLGG